MPALRNTWVVFEISGREKHLSRTQRQACDQYWAELGLSGAVLIVDLLTTRGEKVAATIEPIRCEDRILTVNVAHRIRDGLLHTRFPLLERLDGDPHHWATDDPRLVQLIHTDRKETAR